MKIGETFKLIDLDAAAVFGSAAGLKYSTGYAPPEMVVIKGAEKFEESDKVEANYKGKGKYYPGKISRCRLNGTYDINYDDGERESGVEAEMIRSRDGGGGGGGGGGPPKMARLLSSRNLTEPCSSHDTI